MSMVFSIWTVVVLILFIGIVLWAWSDHNKPGFDAAARLPFDEEADGGDGAAPGDDGAGQ